jgi:bifunctional ADP-heptose synthase (sugar kinase/adenylyltransferase)
MLIEKKIFKKIKDLKKKGKIIGLVHGVFDVIHFGHIKYFLEAKKKSRYFNSFCN